MILQALVKYYEDLERQEKLPKQGWCQAKVSYGINLSTDGDIKNILWLKEERQAGKKQIWISQTMKVPAMLTRSSGVAANFLCDNSKYMLGIDKSGTGKRITECFEAAKEKHLKLLKNTSGEMAQAICAFFYKWNPEKAKENAAVLENWEEITDGGNLIFCMDKKYAQDDKEIEQIWNVESKQSETDISGICLVTGEKTEISRIHRNIKGVPGAQSSGAALVSFNAPSFESYYIDQITYDVNTETTAGRTRLRKVAKQCTNYGRRVQNSVFECILDSAQSVALKGILSDIIDKNKDSLRFYYLGNNYQTKIEHVGIERGIPVDQPLIM